MTYLKNHYQIISFLFLSVALFAAFALGLVPEEHRLLATVLGIAVVLLIDQLIKDLSHRISD